MAAKTRSLPATQNLIPLKKTFGFGSAKRKKKSPEWAIIPIFVRFWSIFTETLEPILAKTNT
jgi:hypothetical protein